MSRTLMSRTLIARLAIAAGVVVIAGPGVAQVADGPSAGTPAVSAGADRVDTRINESGIFDGWDANTDGALSVDEFDEGIYSAIPDNLDLRSEEFGESPEGAGVNNERFGRRYGNANGLYDQWDADGDGVLTRDEFNGAAYDTYDADADGILSEDEFGDFTQDIGSGTVDRTLLGENSIGDTIGSSPATTGGIGSSGPAGDL